MSQVLGYGEMLEAGMVHVNEPTIGGEAQLPFGGVKATGYGDREMCEDGINFLRNKNCIFELFWKWRSIDGSLKTIEKQRSAQNSSSEYLQCDHRVIWF